MSSESFVRPAAAALAGTPGLGSRGLFKALTALSLAGPEGLKVFFARHRTCRESSLPTNVPFADAGWFDSLLAGGWKVLETFQGAGMRFSTPWDEDYPPGLKSLKAPPPFIMSRGRFPEFDRPWVAVVGSRGPSSAGLAAARKTGHILARMGVPVVSGLARGIDGAAHAGCLEANGSTVAVMGSGLSVVYPPEHGNLASEVAETGALVSELLPDAGPDKWTFVSRNRIIAALSAAVVVVAAGRDSGSLQTAAIASGLGRQVVVIVSPDCSETHAGGEDFAATGRAVTATDPRGAVEILLNDSLSGISLDKNKALSVYNNISINKPGFEDLCDIIRDGDTPEEITARSGLPPGKVMACLMRLEMDGLLRRAPDGTIFLEYRGRIE